MSRKAHKKRSSYQKERLTSTLNLIAAILNLTAAVLIAVEKLLE